EVSAESGEGRLIWVDEKEEALKALEPALKDSKRAKVVHDPKVFQLMLGPVENIEHATQFYSYLLRPTTSKHDLADVLFRQFNAPAGGGAGEYADSLLRLAVALRPAIEEKKLLEVYEKIELPLAEVLAEMERVGVRVDPEALGSLSESMEKEVRRL